MNRCSSADFPTAKFPTKATLTCWCIFFRKVQMNQKHVKIVVTGTGGAGKSTLTVRYIRNQFEQDIDPTIENEHHKQVLIGNQNVSLDIIDLAGMEDFVHQHNDFLKQADGFLLCFSLSSNDDEVQQVQQRVQKILQLRQVLQFCDLCIVVVGCKADLPRKVTTTNMQAWLNKYQLPYVETSAKNGTNVREAFELVTKIIMDKQSSSCAVQ